MDFDSDLKLSPGCRDRLMIASSVACIVALFISILGLARSVFDVTWPLGHLGASQLCQQVGHEESDSACSTLAETDTGSNNPSRRLAAALDPTVTPVPATATLRPTSTPMPPKATPGLNATPKAEVPTPVPPATLTTTIPVTAGLESEATTGHLFTTPILLSPEPDAQLQGAVHFQWQWDGEPLPEGMAFDLLIWSEAEHQEHQGAGAYGVVETHSSLECDVDLDYVQTIIDHGGGTYFWTVVVVQEEPYERAGALGETRPFTYVVPEVPADATSQSP